MPVALAPAIQNRWLTQDTTPTQPWRRRVRCAHDSSRPLFLAHFSLCWLPCAAECLTSSMVGSLGWKCGRDLCISPSCTLDRLGDSPCNRPSQKERTPRNASKRANGSATQASPFNRNVELEAAIPWLSLSALCETQSSVRINRMVTNRSINNPATHARNYLEEAICPSVQPSTAASPSSRT